MKHLDLESARYAAPAWIATQRMTESDTMGAGRNIVQKSAGNLDKLASSLTQGLGFNPAS
jgi:hypothetical protein